MSSLIDLTGKRFGRITVLGRVPCPDANTFKCVYWKCRCDCGTEFITSGHSLRQGLTKSCGCLRSEASSDRRFKHGQSRTVQYYKWYRMVAKACKEKLPLYAPWKNFGTYKKWLNDNGYHDGMRFVRIVKEKGFVPDNCILEATNVR